ncbi:GerAB/ArcD/ProY family transporter [Anaerovirgula multivorans]|nr:endospore germination permease [Anaerovirgula multivorans]
MESRLSFGRWEAITLLLNTICVQIFIDFPRVMAEEGATAGWLLVLYNSAIVFFIFSFILKLFLKFEGKDLLDISEEIGGNVLRVIVGFFIIIYFAFILSMVLREFGEGMQVIAFPESPLNFIIMLFLVGIIAGAYFGLESIARFHVLAVPIIIIGLLIILLSVTQYYNFSNLFPVMGTGSYNIFINGFHRISTFSALIILFIITPFLKTHKDLKAVGFTTIGMAAVLLTVTTIIYLVVIPYPVAVESFIPIYQVARLIDIPRIFERIESVFIVIWTGSILLYLSVAFYFLVYTFQKTFKLTYYRPLIIPFAILVFNFSLLPDNYLSTVHLEAKYFSNFAWILAFGMTIILLGVGNIMKNKRQKGTGESD